MDYQIITLKEFWVMGISVRTSNEKNNNKDLDDIRYLWDIFRERNIQDQIPHKESQEVLSLYTDYETNFHGPYTVILGYRVTSIDSIPEGMVAKTIRASKYAVFHVSGGNLVKEVIQTWQKIWLSCLNRTYTADFEVYKVENPHKADIFVAIK